MCKLTFTKGDASIYIVPYAPSKRYYFGTHTFAEAQARATFNFKTQLTSSGANLPHLSLHETGRVHAYVGAEQAGPLRIPPMAAWRGEHIATVTVDRFHTLATFDKVPRSTGVEQDFVFVVEELLESGRLALYLNGAQPVFGDDCPVFFTLTRTTLQRPLYLSIRPWGQDPMGETAERGGVTAIAGWDPSTSTLNSAPFIYIRGE